MTSLDRQLQQISPQDARILAQIIRIVAAMEAAKLSQETVRKLADALKAESR